ncbi:hypothetical protein B0H34DRAFT_669693 [Crassisporium funariophilum]|nr:hypothetical protein B0H34DRAFT_669693 [Crassisporium funariophilum]
MQAKAGRGQTHFYGIILLGAASLYLTWSLFVFSYDVSALLELQRRKSHIIMPLESYSFIGGDHPRRLPVPQKLVKMTVEESAHFAITSPEAQLEWLWTATLGDGHVRIGEEKRMFAVAMFHELHCLRSIRDSIERGWGKLSQGRQSHILHCFNYLRQWTLCSADATLEPGDFTQRNFTRQRVGATHTCIDWLPSYEMMAEKWYEWDDFRVAHNIPWHDDVT